MKSENVSQATVGFGSEVEFPDGGPSFVCLFACLDEAGNASFW